MKRLFSVLAACFIVASAHARTWTEAASGRKIEAEFVSADAQKVTIAVKGGGTFQIELARLSAEAFGQERLKPMAKAETAAKAKIEDLFEGSDNDREVEIDLSALVSSLLYSVSAC